MSPAQAPCPACGGPVMFNVDSSLVTICKHCDSVVARGDGALESLGKVAALADTGAVLHLALGGRYEGKKFTLTGRAQLQHESGSLWDEWYAAFDDGRWGWLAEAQGRYYLTFEQMEPVADAPSFDALTLGQTVPGLKSKAQLVVAEKGQAKAVAAEGEIPYRLVPGEKGRYADLSGKGAAFATLDYSATPVVLYLGKRVTLDELSIKVGKQSEAAPKEITALQLNCPNCAGPLSLRAPDKSERVVCPNCDSLLDSREGALKFLSALEQQKHTPLIPLGKKGTLDGVEWQLIGFMVRSVVYEGTTYPWEEYLLYNAKQGFRWLVQSDGHWSMGGSVDVAEVDTSVRAKYVKYDKQSFRLFQDGRPQVDGVWGEFDRPVQVGETVDSSDYVAAPRMLSCEVSKLETGAEEINWSCLSYLPRADVEKAFTVKELPALSGVAPNQPFPHKKIYRAWRWALGLMFVSCAGVCAQAPDRTVFENVYQLEAQSSQEQTQVFFSDPFELKKDEALEVLVEGPLSNSWVFSQGDFVDEASGLVQSFDVPIEYYSGVDDGESWSEGDPKATVDMAAPPPGNYSLRLEVSRGNFAQNFPLHVRVRQGVFNFGHAMLALFMLSLLPLWTAFRHFRFEVKRWSTSDYSPYSSE